MTFTVFVVVLVAGVELYCRSYYGSWDWMVRPPAHIGANYVRRGLLGERDYEHLLTHWGGPRDAGHLWPLPFHFSGSEVQCGGKPRLLYVAEPGGHRLYEHEGCW
jgi:hypothetical protein